MAPGIILAWSRHYSCIILAWTWHCRLLTLECVCGGGASNLKARHAHLFIWNPVSTQPSNYHMSICISSLWHAELWQESHCVNIFGSHGKRDIVTHCLPTACLHFITSTCRTLAGIHTASTPFEAMAKEDCLCLRVQNIPGISKIPLNSIGNP